MRAFLLIPFFVAARTKKLALCPSTSRQTHSFIPKQWFLKRIVRTCIQLLKTYIFLYVFSKQFKCSWWLRTEHENLNCLQTASACQKTKRRKSRRIHFIKTKSNNIHEKSLLHSAHSTNTIPNKYKAIQWRSFNVLCILCVIHCWNAKESTG